MGKRVFLIVLDSYGIGEMPDAYRWNDEGSNTLKAIRNLPEFDCPNLVNLGLFNIDTVGGGIDSPKGSFARLAEMSMGKDTTTGHWELMGLVLDNPFKNNNEDIFETMVENTIYKIFIVRIILRK